MSPDETTIAIMGEDVPARLEVLEVRRLHFLPDNPRVYAAIREMADFGDLTPDEKQVRIYKCLLKEPSVKKLIPEIKRDGGLQEPVVIRHDTFQVIEGNSRLAAYRKLHDDTDDDRWTHIRCLVVTNLNDDQQTRLLSQAHLKGRTEWSPYAKALMCFRWVKEDKKGESKLADLTGFTPTAIRTSVKIIQLMKENNDDNLSHFSYYDVLVRNRAISAATAKRPKLQERLVSQIKDEAFAAQKMREQLPTILRKPQVLRKFERGDIALEDAYERARVSGTQQRLRKVRDELDLIEKNDIARLGPDELKASQQAVKLIGRILKRVSAMVDTELNRTKD